ncbi:selenocysteine-specific translation elongation factor [Candidatus Desulforudis audaxviator]|uniref:Selenocysteine-specific elongation factor n=1 Tax=Desulforudis audaxviator (strain MP104C) TaxID=477974 RepID=B1I3P7_DESAP|nr:selenocysteine-specific translation elongation factor [Candidatus Desulforudis audaxviator]ACA59606.1 selenocysteine-specific translation elongation factor [Candidatus Desulforudis audaxviator MP104C]AZK59593.1 Selenocysteine-specific translation elongation factor [Candidatus Desulforudis audaxviator]
MNYLVIGTAGHVDHGKTQLIKALTGIDTDRLREEKERGISIELGFAYMDLPDGRRAGIVDVPGHERFVKQMLAGISGIDLVLLVIAADEGVMPQTREHMDIIQLLDIERGIVVLNKVDLVEPDWLELVEEDVRAFLAGSVLEDAPVLRVSAVTGEGLPALRETIGMLTAGLRERTGAGPARLPIDRVFSITGFGTVVTGTLVSGSLKLGDPVEVLPPRLVSRVRTLQVHNQKVQKAGPGQRVAVNLVGLETQEINRGDVLASAGFFKPTRRLDVRLFLLGNTPRPLKNRARVRFHLGAAEILSRVLLLDRDELAPGEECYAQVILEAESVAERGDRFVIRSYSPMRTIGGGRVIDANPPRHKRNQPQVLDRLATLEKGNPGELISQFLQGGPAPLNENEVAQGTGLEPDTVAAVCRELEAGGALRRLPGGGLLAHTDDYRRWERAVIGILKDYHGRYPLREGHPREELRSRAFTGFATARFQDFLQALEADGVVTLYPQSVALREFAGRELPEKARKTLAEMEGLFRVGGMQPPTTAQVLEKLGLPEPEGQEYLHHLIRAGTLVKIDNEWCFHVEAVEEARRRIGDYLAEHEGLSVGEARNLLGTSRRYTLPLLEHFDRVRYTKRLGDLRVLVRK